MDDFFAICEPICDTSPELEGAVLDVPVDSEQYGSGQTSWFCIIA